MAIPKKATKVEQSAEQVMEQPAGQVMVLQAVPAAKKEREVELVKMTDGREVEFVGKRKVLKETLFDPSKIEIEGNVAQFSSGAVSVRMDFRNGETRTFVLPSAMLAKFAGHGAEQKYGDELATTADKPLSADDMVVAVEDLDAQIQQGKWSNRREGTGGVSGASIVILAIMEASGKDQATVKAFLQKKLDNDATLTRQALYASFRNPTTATGKIIKRLEEAKASKASAIDADAALDELS